RSGNPTRCEPYRRRWARGARPSQTRRPAARRAGIHATPTEELRMRLSALTALALTLSLSAGLSPALAQSEPESYVRFKQGKSQRDAGLQTAVAHFRHPERNVEIVLYGVVHIADADYYARVQRDLDSYDVVLYEGVAPGKEEPTD